MNNFIKNLKVLFSCILASHSAYAIELNQSDIYIPANIRIALSQKLHRAQSSTFSRHYTVLNSDAYKRTITASRQKVQQLLKLMQSHREENTDVQVAIIVKQLSDIPYLHTDAMGEGDWQPASTVYKPGAIHLNQNPVYRLDGLNCQTLVQTAMALLHSKNVVQFDKNILKIAYGAAGNPDGDIVRYYNRNNFTDADFNPVNQRNGWLADVTSQGPLAAYAKKITATVTRQKWFLYQQQNLEASVQVLASSDGPAMAHRFTTIYSKLNFPKFDSEDISISYLPKETLAIRQHNGGFQPNQDVFDKIPTPAIAEIVRDPKKWNLHRINIKDILGTELTISHLGLLYRQAFNHGDLIYRKTTCDIYDEHQKICYVTPVICKKKRCNELMFAHATNALPQEYFWYQKPDGNYACSPTPPEHGVKYTSCNRVVTLPLFDYLTEYQLGGNWNMELHSILGVHIEKLF